MFKREGMIARIKCTERSMRQPPARLGKRRSLHSGQWCFKGVLGDKPLLKFKEWLKFILSVQGMGGVEVETAHVDHPFVEFCYKEQER